MDCIGIYGWCFCDELLSVCWLVVGCLCMKYVWVLVCV